MSGANASPTGRSRQVMTVLAFDIASGGVSAALFTSRLELLRKVEVDWDLAVDEAGKATLSVETIAGRIKQVLRNLRLSEPLDAVCIGSFMHNCVLLDRANKPLTPVFTWLDRTGESGIEYVRSRTGDDFHQRTGCRFHPMFPVFKLAALYVDNRDLLARSGRIVSVKAFLIHRLTGVWIEDHGMASASGLYNILDGDWDSQLLELLELERGALPPIASRNHVPGAVTREAAGEFGLTEGAIVVNGSGDGFLAHTGSGCEAAARISASLGTSAVTRQTVSQPILNEAAGTFCYETDENSYLLGCAGSNGGNVLDWGRSIFGEIKDEDAADNLPVFIPLLHGERSPEWNPRLAGSWHGLTSLHTAADLSRSVLEGVIFNLGYFVEILRATSGAGVSDIVLSGNGFLQPIAGLLLAAIAGAPVWMPSDPGLASLRGAAICALRARDLPVPQLGTTRVPPLTDPGILERYEKYRELRKGTGAGTGKGI